LTHLRRTNCTRERPARQARLWLLLAGAAAALCACGVHFHSGPIFDNVDQSKFPATDEGLLALSFRSYNFNGPVQAVTVSLLAAETVLARNPDNDLANYLATRAAYWLIEFNGPNLDRLHLAELGFKYAEAAEKVDGSKAAYPFFEGVHLGYKMRENLRPPLINIRKTRDYFQRALQLDASYDQGAPMRAMGILLIKSPPWPAGVGDDDEGVKYLEKACTAFPTYPANHLYYAEGLLNTGSYDKALHAVDATHDVLKETDWGVPGQVWKKQADELRAKIEKKRAGDAVRALHAEHHWLGRAGFLGSGR